MDIINPFEDYPINMTWEQSIKAGTGDGECFKTPRTYIGVAAADGVAHYNGGIYHEILIYLSDGRKVRYSEGASPIGSFPRNVKMFDPIVENANFRDGQYRSPHMNMVEKNGSRSQFTKAVTETQDQAKAKLIPTPPVVTPPVVTPPVVTPPVVTPPVVTPPVVTPPVVTPPVVTPPVVTPPVVTPPVVNPPVVTPPVKVPPVSNPPVEYHLPDTTNADGTVNIPLPDGTNITVSDIPTINIPMTNATKAHIAATATGVLTVVETAAQVIPDGTVRLYVMLAAGVITVAGTWFGVYVVPNLPKITRK